MHFSKKIHCATLKKNRSSDNFLIQKKYSDFLYKIQDSGLSVYAVLPSMLYY